MIALAGGTLTFTSIATGTPASGGANEMTSEWGTGFISPGIDQNDSQRFMGFLELWVENGTDKDLDFATIVGCDSTLAATMLAAVKRYALLLLPATARFVFTAPPGEVIVGPMYVRGTTTDPTSGGLRFGGWVR
jgi:hypothetical protein